MQVPFLSSQEVCLDLGSAMTKVMMEQKVIWQQPTCLAVYEQTQSVISIGDAAVTLVGKEPTGVEVWFPFSQGEIVNRIWAKTYLRALADTVLSIQPHRRGSRYHWQVHQPVGLSPAARQVLTQVSKEALGSITMIPTSAAVQSLISQESLSQSGAIMILGAQTTQLLFFAQGTVLSRESFRWGIDEIQAVMSQVLLEQLQLVASRATLQELQTKLASVHLSGKEADRSLVIQVKSLETQASSAHIVTARQFAPQILESLSDVLLWLQGCLLEVPGEVQKSLLSQGVWLAGGGAQLPGLVEVVSELLQCPVQVVPEPQVAIVRGLRSQGK